MWCVIRYIFLGDLSLGSSKVAAAMPATNSLMCVIRLLRKRAAGTFRCTHPALNQGNYWELDAANSERPVWGSRLISERPNRMVAITANGRIRIRGCIKAQLEAIWAELVALNRQLLRSGAPPASAIAQYRELNKARELLSQHRRELVSQRRRVYFFLPGANRRDERGTMLDRRDRDVCSDVANH